LQSYLGLKLLLFLLLLSGIKCLECPSPQVLNPCICFRDTDNNRRGINCGGNNAINLKQIFTKISSLLDKNSKNFERFKLNNTAISVLEDNTFSDITFTEIIIDDAKNLWRLLPNAFSPNNTQTIIDFQQSGDSLLGEDKYNDDLFTALSSLNSVESILLNSYSLTHIPDGAFRPITGMQSNLTFLNFNSYDNKPYKIKSIGNDIVYYLYGLREIYLNDQQIDHIPVNAFEFWRSSDYILFIYLNNNKLNDTSLEIGSFTNCQRPISIEFNNNQFTFLNQRIFENILKAHNTNSMVFGG